MDSAEPSLKEFMAHPQMQYLKKNPKAIAAICAILCAVGIPGAASVSALVSLIGPAEILFPMNSEPGGGGDDVKRRAEERRRCPRHHPWPPRTYCYGNFLAVR